MYYKYYNHKIKDMYFVTRFVSQFLWDVKLKFHTTLLFYAVHKLYDRRLRYCIH